MASTDLYIPQTNPSIPKIPHMADLSDLLANLANNWYHLRFVLALLFGIMFATYLVGKLMQEYRDEQRDIEWLERAKRRMELMKRIKK